MRILVTGGAGYIGSHTSLALVQQGHEVCALDNLSNSSRHAMTAVAGLAQRPVALEIGDVRDARILDDVFRVFRPDAVVHCAGLKAVGESVAKPLTYYDHNVVGSLRLVEAMTRHEVFRLVFSSSATVYGEPAQMPVSEDAPLQPTNPYGETKLAVERMLGDAARADPRWHITLLRYFNPVGAHPSGDLGEDPSGTPNNLMPLVMQVASGRRQAVQLFGDDYPTPDGTPIRDYIHIVDLAEAHARAILRLQPGCRAINLGTGRGHSVKEVLAACEAAVGHEIATQVAPRRPGDATCTYANPSLAAGLLDWRSTRTLADMCADAWRWQQKNPAGYAK